VKLHDGSVVRFSKVPADYDPRDRGAVQEYLRLHQEKGEIPTGLLYLNEDQGDLHDVARTVETPLTQVPFQKLCPGSAALDKLLEDYR